jgi:23S rRNA (guanosine2251-2'-O)-methyltransferase
LIRSAEAAGANGLVLPRERAAPLTSTALKASAGAAEYVPVARVTNLVRALNDLKDAGFFVIGAAADADHSLYDQDLNLRLALVIGGEGRGLRRLVRETCDVVVSIPLAGRIESLNASVAGAVAMFEYVRQGRGQ